MCDEDLSFISRVSSDFTCPYHLIQKFSRQLDASLCSVFTLNSQQKSYHQNAKVWNNPHAEFYSALPWTACGCLWAACIKSTCQEEKSWMRCFVVNGTIPSIYFSTLFFSGVKVLFSSSVWIVNQGCCPNAFVRLFRRNNFSETLARCLNKVELKWERDIDEISHNSSSAFVRHKVNQ